MSRNASISSLGWSLVCAAPFLVSSGYVICVIVFCSIERHRAAVQIDLRSRLREFLAECGDGPSAGALGVSPDLVYTTARVMNRIRISEGPVPLYRIGWRFAGRLS